MTEVWIDWDLCFSVMQLGLIEELKRRVPIHDGELRQSISTEVSNNKLIVYMVSYALYVEEGTAPHWTSVENLKKWARDKLGDEDLAYALQKSIATKGTKPHPFIKETLIQEFPRLLAKGLGYKGVVKVIIDGNTHETKKLI